MKVFKLARIKLTALFLAIIMLITVSFSVGVYNILSHEVGRFARIQRNRIEGRTRPNIDMEDRIITDIIAIPPPNGKFPIPPVDPDLVNEAEERLVTLLVIIDGVVLVCSGLLGYVLAGKTLNPIKEMVEEQNRFISDASHELKTPLTALKSSFEVFLREKNPNVNEARELIKDGVNDVDNLNNLSTSLLELARFEQPNHKNNFSLTALEELMGKAVDIISPLAQKNRTEIVFKKSDIKIFGDKDKLIRLFTILLDNAVKYSPAGRNIEVIAEKVDGKMVQIKVVDHGIGIAPKDLPHVFDRFYRADLSRNKTDTAGYGLGLSIAKSIVEVHDGKISITSELGKGTTVQLDLRITA